MGACLSNEHSRRKSSAQTRTNSTRSDSYNKLILEHLEKNKENFEVIAKSISALSAANLVNNTPASLIRSNQLTSITSESQQLIPPPPPQQQQQQQSSQCNCKCNSRLNEHNELKTNKPKLTSKKNSMPLFSKSKIRSINLVNKSDNRHKRYLVEVSDSYFSDLNCNKNSSLSSSDLTSSSEQKIIYRSFSKDLNKNTNKITKLKSKTQNEINCKNCENIHLYDEINHLSYLDCSASGKSHHHHHPYKTSNQHNNIRRAYTNRKSIPSFENHHDFFCKQCQKYQQQQHLNQEASKLATKTKSHSTNTIKFKDILDEDFYYDDEDLFFFKENSKEVKLNKSETINCGTLCNNTNSCNNNNTSNVINNFHADFKNDNYENFNINDDHDELLVSNNRKKNSQNLTKHTGITQKNDNNKLLKNNNLNETTSSISSIFYNNKNYDIKHQLQENSHITSKEEKNHKQNFTNPSTKNNKSSKLADYCLDKLSITFSSFSSTSSSSSTESFAADLNNSLSLTNSNKSLASAKTLTLNQEKMQSNSQVKFSSSNEDQSLANSTDKLKLQNVIDSVGFLLFPSAKFVNQALKNLLKEYNLFDLFQHAFKNEYTSLFSNTNQLYVPPNERLIEKILINLFNLTKNSAETKTDLRTFVRKLGSEYFKQLYNEYEKSFLSIGGTMFSFYNNISSLHESLINHSHFGPRFLYLNDKYTGFAPSFRADPTSNQLVINVYTIQEKKTQFLTNFYLGLIESSAQLIWDLDIQCDKLKNLELDFSFAKLDSTSLHSFILGYKVTLKSPSQLDHFVNSSENNTLNELSLSSDLFKTTFPFMILIDRNLNIVQIGDSLVRSLGQAILNGNGSQFFSYFSIEEPKLNDYSFDSLILNENMNFKLKIKAVENKNFQIKEMEIKGSIIYENESDCLLFLGSPVIQSLDELNQRGMYLSDIPIHDAVRDIILVGEQTKAQEGLKCRMEKLKKSILKAHEDIDIEKSKNIELLNMIFPSEIAEKLWMGQKVNARNIENVTLLYSDIVGFTSICSSAEPIEIVKMLKNIYTEFDNFCGLVDAYKIETIGDAYIVAAGLHKSSKYHAQRAAWMSLLMLDEASKNYTNKNEKIKMRIGLHTGDVLAGIVGIKQPRYCLFGNNCAITNKFESNSEENRIHVSPVTKVLLDSTDTFELEPRSSEYLPDNWTSLSKEKEITWFLNDYKHKRVAKEKKCLEHIKAALNDLNEHLN